MTQQSDHDILIGLRADVTNLIKQINGYVPQQCERDNNRICNVEATLDKWSRYGWAIMLAMSVAAINGAIGIAGKVLGALEREN